jgi:hypothetical protein
MLQLETQCLLDLVVVHEQHIQPREVRAALTNAGHAHVLQCAIRQVVVSYINDSLLMFSRSIWKNNGKFWSTIISISLSSRLL